ncbi:MAG: DUF599 domain-containing protein [Candidatus Saliniplasma sp.]
MLIGIYSICLWGYHYTYFLVTGRKDVITRRNMINESIVSWFEITLKEKDHILMIHQLRNMIMSVTFLATTAVLLIGFLFGFSSTSLPGPFGNEGYPFWLMIFTLIFSFFNLLLCLRHFTRITFLIRSAPEKLEAISGEKADVYLGNLFIRGNREYTMGRRSMLYSLIILTWPLHPVVFLVLTIGMTVVFVFNYDF